MAYTTLTLLGREYQAEAQNTEERISKIVTSIGDPLPGSVVPTVNIQTITMKRTVTRATYVSHYWDSNPENDLPNTAGMTYTRTEGKRIVRGTRTVETKTEWEQVAEEE